MRMTALVFLCFMLSCGCWSRIPGEPIESAVKGETFTESGEYRLGPSDQFSLKVVGDETFNGEYLIDANGNANLPLARAVSLGGLTNRQAELKISESVKPFVKSPSVFLTVTSRKSFKVYFNGEFNKVGATQFEGPVSTLEAITIAGGLSPFANGRLVLIRTVGGSSHRYVTTFKELCLGSAALDHFRLERGDIVIAE